ncbi:MAG: glutaredoxin family protein [Chloroflexota bacterium]
MVSPISPAAKELVMYTRTTPCPFVSLAKRVLDAEQIPYRELFIDHDKTYEQRVLNWTGFLSVPTLIIAWVGQDLPYIEPSLLPKDTSPRGEDRGPMLTEPNEDQLRNWLRKHALLG